MANMALLFDFPNYGLHCPLLLGLLLSLLLVLLPLAQGFWLKAGHCWVGQEGAGMLS